LVRVAINANANTNTNTNTNTNANATLDTVTPSNASTAPRVDPAPRRDTAADQGPGTQDQNALWLKR
jgi:carbohydrate-binding DOMON domain-containing protein